MMRRVLQQMLCRTCGTDITSLAKEYGESAAEMGHDYQHSQRLKVAKRALYRAFAEQRKHTFEAPMLHCLGKAIVDFQDADRHVEYHTQHAT